MDSDFYPVIKGQINQPGNSEIAGSNLPLNQSNVSPEFDMNNLNLNSSIISSVSNEREIYVNELSNSVSSPSIALLNAKSKAMKNLKRVDANNYTDENHSKYNQVDSNKNLTSEMNLFKNDHFLTQFDTRNSMPQIKDDCDQFTNTNNTSNNNNKAFQVRSETVPIIDVSGQDAAKPLRLSDTEDIEIINNEEVPHRNPNLIKKSKNNKGFALFGRKKKYSTAQFYGTQHLVRNAKNRSTSKKINNKVDWSDNSKLGMHIWSDHSNPTNDACYINDSDALEFHDIDSHGKCLYASKNIPKKKCNICKIVVHEMCVESIQQNVKCRATYRENVSRKKSFREKDQSVNNSTPITNPITNSNQHHWICHKFDENSFKNKCQSCQKSYTNRFGLQTNRTIIICSWCKQAHHLKCFKEDCHLKTEECSFGEHKQLIVPPSWIVKLSNKSSVRSNFLFKNYNRTSIVNNLDNHSQLLVPTVFKQQSSLRQSNKAFIVRPPAISTNSTINMVKPLLVLINPKSGGKVGPKLLKKFTWLLNARQVFDLSLNPKFPLYLYRNVPNLRILVGGGDGSVGWVLSVIDQIKFLDQPPSVAVLPLGTGNDLARSLHWGGTYSDESLSKILQKVSESKSVKMDRWKVITSPNTNASISEIDESAITSLKNDVWNNYFSLGADAQVALNFHDKRETNPQKFTSRWYNLLSYFDSWKGDIIKRSWKDLKDYIELECDGVNYTEMIKSKGYHFILFLNIPKYSGGTNPWGWNQNDTNFQPQSMNDGRIEVIGCYTSHLAKFQFGIGGDRICQAKHIKVTTSTSIPIQMDGEPAKLAPSIIQINHKNQASMLEHVKNNTDSPLIGYHSNIIKNFEVKCISLRDYKEFRKNPRKLEENAINVGTICTSNLLNNLSKVRNLINALLKNCASGFYSTKWSFLSAEEFYRISDDSDECLLDIVSSDEIVYILDESEEDYENKEMNENKTSIIGTVNQNINKFTELEDFEITSDTELSKNAQSSKFKIPTSHTSQQITDKPTSSMPSSMSTQFNSKVPSYI